MTAYNYTDGSEVPSGTTTRSAWDAVKREVTLIATYATMAGCSIITGVCYLSNAGHTTGHTVLATVNGAVAGIFLGHSAYRARHVVNILKNIPA